MIILSKILIVEDDNDIHLILNEILKQENYQVLDAYSGTEALRILKNEEVDLILLDLILPGINGEQLIEEIKNTPIIVISAKLESSDKVNCLLNGANDYITKPFNKDELLARIKVQLRTNNSNHDLIYKGLRLLNDYQTLLVNNLPIKLTKTEYAILKQLLLNTSRVVTKTKLLELIEGDTLDGDENSLKVHISNIRKKIKKISQEEYIESVWGIGFKMKE